MKLKSLVLTLTLLCSAFSSEFLPSNIYQLDSRFTHHVLVVEKSTHKLYLYENNNQFPKLLKTYQIATGKIKGNKQVQGDKKTPEGVYRFKKFHSADYLIDSYGKNGLIYGAGAFTMNYPNAIDVKLNKTGGGIWLHSTDDDTRVSKGLDSRGCVVATDKDLKDISQYIDLEHTPIVVVQNLKFLSKETWLEEKNNIVSTVLTWAKSWKNKEFDTYINQYSPSEFSDPRKGNYYSYKAYKKAVFSRNDQPKIDFTDISILKHDNYAVVTMVQNYRSEVITDIGKKVLYLKQNENYEWKIVTEQWYKLPQETRELAFKPSMRFFSSKNESAQTQQNIQ